MKQHILMYKSKECTKQHVQKTMPGISQCSIRNMIFCEIENTCTFIYSVTDKAIFAQHSYFRYLTVNHCFPVRGRGGIRTAKQRIKRGTTSGFILVTQANGI